jgi:hypothetical protein
MDPCAICKDENIIQPVTLECNHTFCGMCIVRWFRAASGERVCPLCRDAGVNNLESAITIGDAHERARILLNMARRKTASKLLKSTVQRFRRIQESAKVAERELREFRAAHRDDIKQFQKLRMRKWAAKRKERGMKKRIGFSVFHDDLPVPIVTGLNSHRFRYNFRI